MGELTAEGKRQYKMYDLKAKIHAQMAVLGGRAYDVLDGKKNPATDGTVKAVFAKIKKLEAQLSKLEGVKETKVPAPKKPAVKAKAAPAATEEAKKTVKKAPEKARAKK
jgi:hypothetical protein